LPHINRFERSTNSSLRLCRRSLTGSMDSEVFEERIQETKKSGKELTSRDMVDYARYLQREQTRTTELQSSIRIGDTVEPDQRIKILMGDFREVLSESMLPEASVDMILTDPPYAMDFLHLWKDLSKLAARILKPGRLLVSYSGNYHLEKVISLVCEHLRYLWIAAVINRNPPDTVFPRKIMTYWKPVLLFSKGDYRPIEKREWFRDRIDGDGRGKTHHA